MDRTRLKVVLALTVSLHFFTLTLAQVDDKALLVLFFSVQKPVTTDTVISGKATNDNGYPAVNNPWD